MQSNNCDLKKLYHYAVVYKSSLLKLLVLTVVLPVVFNNKRDIYKNVGNRYESLHYDSILTELCFSALYL